jgi:hypothetical protein
MVALSKDRGAVGHCVFVVASREAAPLLDVAVAAFDHVGRGSISSINDHRASDTI